MTTTTKTSSIAEKAMLVSLNISQWRAYKADKKVAQEVADQHGSDASMGTYRKSLVARKALQSMNAIAQAARQDHDRMTLPWADAGPVQGTGRRILKSSAYFEYRDKMNAHETAFWNEFRNNFKPNYLNHVEEARVALNGLFKPEEYPSISQIEHKFGFHRGVSPVPSGEDFRVDFGDEETERVKAQIEAAANATLKTALQDVWARLAEVVGKMSARLKAYTGEAEGAFRDSLVSNIVEVLDLVPTLNLTDDPALNKFAAKIRRELTAHTPEVLRDDETIRNDTARRAEEILSKMLGYLS